MMGSGAIGLDCYWNLAVYIPLRANLSVLPRTSHDLDRSNGLCICSTATIVASIVWTTEANSRRSCQQRKSLSGASKGHSHRPCRRAQHSGHFIHRVKTRRLSRRYPTRRSDLIRRCRALVIATVVSVRVVSTTVVKRTELGEPPSIVMGSIAGSMMTVTGWRTNIIQSTINRRIYRNRLPRHLRILAQPRVPLLIPVAATPITTATANLRHDSIRRHRAHAQVTPRRDIVRRYCLDGRRRGTGCERIAKLGAKRDRLVALRDGDQRSRERRQRRVADWRGDRLPEIRAR